MSDIATATPTPAAGVKRKRTSDVKYYAVHQGRRPGVYYSWPECLSQVKSFAKAEFKSFTTIKDAESFVAHGHASASKLSAKGAKKFYGVTGGRNPGVYDNWSTASAQLASGTGAKVKAFASKVEAEEFASGRRGPSSAVSPSTTPFSVSSNKKQKRKAGAVVSGNELPPFEDVEYEPGYGPLPADAEDGLDARLTLDPSTGKLQYKTEEQMNQTQWKAVRGTDNDVVRIYTDGSSLGNGADGAVAGVGVYFGPQDKRNVSEALQGPRQTNQRAELTAILRALEIAPRDRPVAIYSDSMYAIKCVTEWFHRWRTNGWVSSSKKPVENKDLVEKILGLLEERDRIGARDSVAEEERDGSDETRQVVKGRSRVEFIWVKGHKDDPGNVAADGLAVAGAQEAKSGLA